MGNDQTIPDGSSKELTPPNTEVSSSPLQVDKLQETDFPIMFGRYKLLSTLGEGGMARVFRAELQGPAGFRKQVALKVIKPGTGGHANQKEMMGLIQEACLGGRLKHPHIVDVYELGEVHGQLFISMELVDGLTLSELIRNAKMLPTPVILEISVAITSGLIKAHGLIAEGKKVGLVHRDLKPSNILISWDGAIKIADFGIAFTKRKLPTVDTHHRINISGTPSYMSPEQVRGEELDGRSDLFALSLVIAEMLLGENPLGHEYVFNRVTNDRDLVAPLLDGSTVHRIDNRVPGLSPLILHCLEPKPENRIANAENLRCALEEIQDQVGHRTRLSHWLKETTKDTAQNGEHGPKNQSTAIYNTGTTSGLNLKPPFPTPSSKFVGRTSELEALGEQFNQSTRLISIKGAGGSGKTRLAHHFAWQAATTWPGGARIVDLTEARTLMGIIQATGAALELHLSGEDSETLVQQLGHAISGRGHSLLVFDNFEQVIEHARTTLGQWLQMSSETRFLITSRQSLKLPGEHVFSLSPLSLEDAVSLFEIRARAVGARWTLDEAVVDTIKEIVEKLDRLPLAIELASARSAILSPHQLLDRLSDRFRLLSDPNEKSARQSGLKALIDWSWALLKPWEQAALTQLSVFRGGFSMEAAEHVIDLTAWPEAPWALDVVSSLFDKSLLFSREVQGQPRFGMYASIQEYAAEKLGSDTETSQARHASHYAKFGTEGFIESLDTHGGTDRQRALVLELDNLLTAVHASNQAGNVDVSSQCAIAAAEIFRNQGPFSDGIKLLEPLISKPVSQLTLARILQRLAGLMFMAGQPEKAREKLNEALLIVRALGRRANEGFILGALAWSHHLLGQKEVALTHIEEALSIAQEVNDSRGEIINRTKLASMYVHQGQSEDAKRNFEEVIDMARAIGDRRGEGRNIGNMAIVALMQGRSDEALQLFKEALSIANELDDHRSCGALYVNLANLLAKEGKTTEAHKNYERSAQIAKRIGNRGGLCAALVNLAGLHVENGEQAEAEKSCAEAISIAEELSDNRRHGFALGTMGDAMALGEKTVEAEEYYRRAIDICDDAFPVAAGTFRGSLALLKAKQGEFEEAKNIFSTGQKILENTEPLQLAKFHCKRSLYEHLSGDATAAHQALDQAEDITNSLQLRETSPLMKTISETRKLITEDQSKSWMKTLLDAFKRT